MEVTDLSFRFQLLPILRSISNATFVAIDLEMSGIPTRRDGLSDRSRDAGKPSLQQQYEESKEAAGKYQILQLGITCVEEDRERDMYLARPYNFNITPLFVQGDKLDISRDITFSSSAIHFLQKNSFNVGKIFTKGVPYLSREEEFHARQKFAKRQENSASIPDIIILENDQAAWEFYQKARHTISKWANAKKKEMDFVNIGAPGGLNGYQRRLVHQLVRNEFPSYKSFARSNGDFMQIEKLDEGREAQIVQSRLESFEAALLKQIGIRYVIEALAGGDLSSIDPKWFSVAESGQPAFIDVGSKRKEVEEIQEALKEKIITVVGHNLFLDLVFIYRTFVGKLPNKVEDFSRQIHALFPHVIDTKYLATQADGSSQTRSGLKDLCNELKNQNKPFIALAENHIDYGKAGKEHEAGYDSWMTAQVLVKLSAKLAAEQQAAKLEYNKLAQLQFEGDFSLSGFEEKSEGAMLSLHGFDISATSSVLRDLKFSTIEKSNSTYGLKTIDISIPKFGAHSVSSGSRFDLLPIEGQDDNDSTTSSSDKGNGGVLLTAGQKSLTDGPGDDWAKDADSVRVRGSAEFVVQPTDFFTESTTSDQVSRYYSARQLNKSTRQPEDPNEPRQWIPHINGPWWRLYANRLRVYGTETGICNLDDQIN